MRPLRGKFNKTRCKTYPSFKPSYDVFNLIEMVIESQVISSIQENMDSYTELENKNKKDNLRYV